jgi:site-specific DNA-methyltransferase (adenine-specific)
MIYNEDCLIGLKRIPDKSIDACITDPPYSLNKDYGNDSDKLSTSDYLTFMYKWIDEVNRVLKDNGSFYIFLSWRYSPEIFSYIKTKMNMVNEIIWDRRVPSMGGSTRSYSSVHDNIGFFVKGKGYTFNIDDIRIPYDEETKKKHSRKQFEGSKWLELGCNPKDVWSISRIHGQSQERQPHPTQKPLELINRLVLASSNENDTILDPFLGSGTTAISCINLKRNIIGFELNSIYYTQVLKRIQDNSNG